MGPGVSQVRWKVEACGKTHTESGWSQTQDFLHAAPSIVLLIGNSI
jgi:hypothetical protein